MDLIEIGEIIRSKRRHQGMTQEELGKRAGLSRVRISQLETGRIFDMKFGNVIDVLGALGLDLRISSHNAGRPVFEELLERNDRDGIPGP